MKKSMEKTMRESDLPSVPEFDIWLKESRAKVKVEKQRLKC